MCPRHVIPVGLVALLLVPGVPRPVFADNQAVQDRPGGCPEGPPCPPHREGRSSESSEAADRPGHKEHSHRRKSSKPKVEKPDTGKPKPP